MHFDYNDLSSEAKVWIYPSNRKFYPQELDTINKELMDFTTNWKKDSDNFKCSYQFLHNRFIIFLADETSNICNGDLDKQVSFILQLQQKYNVELLDKMNVCFKQGDFIQYKDIKDFKKLIKNKSVSDKTIVFDNLVQTKYELENYWEIPISESWYNRFL